MCRMFGWHRKETFVDEDEDEGENEYVENCNCEGESLEGFVFDEEVQEEDFSPEGDGDHGNADAPSHSACAAQVVRNSSDCFFSSENSFW